MSVRTVSLGKALAAMVRKRASTGDATTSPDETMAPHLRPLVVGRIEPAGALALMETQENQMVQVAKAKTASWTTVQENAQAKATADAVPNKACPRNPDGSPNIDFVRTQQRGVLSQNIQGMGGIPVPKGFRAKAPAVSSGSDYDPWLLITEVPAIPPDASVGRDILRRRVENRLAATLAD